MVKRPKRAQLESMTSWPPFTYNLLITVKYCYSSLGKGVHTKDNYKQCRQDMMVMCKTGLDEICAKHRAAEMIDGIYN